MFESLVAGSLEPEILKLLKDVKQALAGVHDRLDTQQKGADLGVAMAAHLQLSALDAWSPMITDLIAQLEKPKPAAHPAPLGHGH